MRIFTSYEANRFVKVSFIAQLSLNCLRTSNKLSLGGSWYVQNVSTFPNLFAVVFPLICVFWMQLTRTNAVFSRIALVSSFCAEIQLSVKILENIAKILFCPKTHGARRRDGEEPRGAHTWPRRGLGWAAPRCGVAASNVDSTSPSIIWCPTT